jgi:protein-L-isoaspartate(D-aspartate) O-methyltransferase
MDRLREAFMTYGREAFLPDEVRDMAEFDNALPIGHGQTNSQPSTVRMMLEWLGPDPGNKVLDVGSGSAWTTALLSHLVGTTGKVYAVEKEPELLSFGEANCRRFGIRNASFHRAGKTYGLRRYGPYDRILVSAAADAVPDELLEQLAVGGRMVIPVHNSIFVIDRHKADDYEAVEHPGFVFVPLM